jgi:hypothetical protein
MSTKFSVNIFQKQILAEIWAMFAWCLQQMFCVVPIHFNTILSSLSHRATLSLECPDRHSLLVAVIRVPLVHTSARNASKSLHAPTVKNAAEDWDQEIVQASWLGHRVLTTAHRMSGSGAVSRCRANEVVPHHAWTTRVVLIKRHMFQEYR